MFSHSLPPVPNLLNLAFKSCLDRHGCLDYFCSKPACIGMGVLIILLIILTWVAALLMIVTLFIATMMGVNTRLRAKEEDDLLAGWISRVSLYLAFVAFMVPSIIANYWPSG